MRPECAVSGRWDVGTLSFVEKEVKIDQNTYPEHAKNNYQPDERILTADRAAFMRDGASTRAAKTVREYLKDSGLDLLEGPPAKSTVLNVTDYAIWRIPANEIEMEKEDTETDLRAALRKPISALVLGVIRISIDQFERRFDVCIGGEGRIPG